MHVRDLRHFLPDPLRRGIQREDGTVEVIGTGDPRFLEAELAIGVALLSKGETWVQIAYREPEMAYPEDCACPE